MSAEIQLDGHRLVARCPDSLDEPAKSLLAKLAQLHRRGPRLKPGSVIDFGWAPLRIEEDGGAWLVCEPDFAHDDQTFVRGVAVTLRVLDDQARIVRLAHATPHATRYDETVMVAAATRSAPTVTADRGETSTAGYSGWYFAPDGDKTDADTSKAESIRAGRLAVERPAWASVLALPARFVATFEGDRLTAVYDENSRKVASFDGDGHA